MVRVLWGFSLRLCAFETPPQSFLSMAQASLGRRQRLVQKIKKERRLFRRTCRPSELAPSCGPCPKRAPGLPRLARCWCKGKESRGERKSLEVGRRGSGTGALRTPVTVTTGRFRFVTTRVTAPPSAPPSSEPRPAPPLDSFLPGLSARRAEQPQRAGRRQPRWQGRSCSGASSRPMR